MGELSDVGCTMASALIAAEKQAVARGERAKILLKFPLAGTEIWQPLTWRK